MTFLSLAIDSSFKAGVQKIEIGKPPDKDRIDKMYDKVNEMPVPDIKLEKMIIQDKRQGSQRPGRIIVPPGAHI